MRYTLTHRQTHTHTWPQSPQSAPSTLSSLLFLRVFLWILLFRFGLKTWVGTKNEDKKEDGQATLWTHRVAGHTTRHQHLLPSLQLESKVN